MGADVFRLTARWELTWPSVPGVPFLAQHPDDPTRYEIRQVRWRPSRFLGVASRRVNFQRYVDAVEHIVATHGAIDLLHGHFLCWSGELLAVKRALGIPYVVTEHHTSWQGHWSEPPPSPGGMRMARRVAGEAACVVAVCQSLRDQLTHFGLDGSFEVLVNPVETERLPWPTRPRRNGVVEIVSTGGLRPTKAYDVLLDAFASARTRDPRLHLTVIGEGPDRDALEQQHAALALGNSVQLLGNRDHGEVLSRLQNAHMFTLASRAENLTVAVLEALCSGLPVVTTNVGGHAEVMRPGFGEVVPPDDPIRLAESLLHVAARLDSFDREQIAQESRARFSVQAVGRELAALYRTVITAV